jgi:hypothetical protein
MINVAIPVQPLVIRGEYDDIASVLTPLLKKSGLDSPFALHEDDEHQDISFLAKEMDVDALKLAYVAVAFKLNSLAKYV